MIDTIFNIILYLFEAFFIIFVILFVAIGIFAVYACLKILDPIAHIDTGGSWFPDEKKKDNK